MLLVTNEGGLFSEAKFILDVEVSDYEKLDGASQRKNVRILESFIQELHSGDGSASDIICARNLRCGIKLKDDN